MTTILSIHCAKCGVPIDLQIVDWEPTETSSAQSFGCPDCKAANSADVPGTIVLAVRRIVTNLNVRV